MGEGRVAGPPPVVRPARYVFLECMKAIEGGDDSRVKVALLRMEREEIDHLLRLTQRLEGLIKQHQRKGG